MAELSPQNNSDRWQAFTDAEIEAIADQLADGEPPHIVGDDVDPELTEASLRLYAELCDERRRRSFDGCCRPGSPYLSEALDG
jgi:hypothetical protein